MFYTTMNNEIKPCYIFYTIYCSETDTRICYQKQCKYNVPMKLDWDIKNLIGECIDTKVEKHYKILKQKRIEQKNTEV